jgi:hypothetical protein
MIRAVAGLFKGSGKTPSKMMAIAISAGMRYKHSMASLLRYEVDDNPPKIVWGHQRLLIDDLTIVTLAVPVPQLALTYAPSEALP